MSYRIKVPAKTLPVDEAHMLSGLEHQLHRLQDYRRPILVGLAVLVLAAGVVGGVFWMDRQASQKAQDLEREATRLVMGRPTNDPAKAESLLKQAMTQYRQVVDQYPRTASAPLALFHLGNAQVQANDLPGAIETYQRFLLLYGSNPSLAELAQQRLAYAYLLKGDRDQAAKAFTAIVNSPGALNKDQALFELARLEESQSRPEGALAHYQELIKSFPNSLYTSEATIRTKVMDTKKSRESAVSPQPAVSVAVPSASKSTPTAPPSNGKKKP
ncbi:MAG TPA: tetratricopeptide repeat protein [Nitrospira sp.]|nr:tetratricopeptide repeat protein [Nitrospira sp.]